MIVNLEKFIAEERPKWERLDAMLRTMAADPWGPLPLDQARELERLYQRAAADLARLATYAAEPETRRYLENLVARGHAEIHGARAEGGRVRPVAWFTRTLPQTFRRQFRAFAFALALTLGGAIFGGAALAFDPEAKQVLMPFDHLRGSPKERVAQEREERGERLSGGKAQFSGMLMTHNTRVTLTAVALGMSWGLGTLVLLFYNGAMIGAVAADYVLAGETPFLLGWLLPHGAIEIPAILVGGQAGFVLAGAILGRGRRERLAARLRGVMPDVVTLSLGAALMLVWAGVVEAFFSQYHEPVLPYAVKIAFGCLELAALGWFLARAGRAGGTEGKGAAP
ncbi:MAG: stage II sporulation protein M [Opitutaceae bacterium]|nr:stage II sporulation protein M [Opitutaceae bacterium]